MLTRLISIILVIAATAAPPALMAGEEPPSPGDDADEIDPLALASVLIRDRHFERAAAVLGNVPIDDPALDIDRGKFFMLLGLTRLELADHKGAEAALEKAVAAGIGEKVVFIFLAQARFHLSDFQGAVEAVEQAGGAGKLPGIYLIHAQCLWRMGDRHAAYAVLEEALRAYPDDEMIQKNRVLLLVDLGLYQEAVAAGTRFLSDTAAKPDAYVALAEALISGKQYREAVILLETARLNFPENENVVIQLAKAYMADDHLLIAARLFEHASRIAPRLILDAAELYRRAGQLDSAVRLNAGIIDQKSKVRQRLGLLIELERFEEAAALAPRLQRLGLLEEDAVTYGVAYAYFMTGRFTPAERELKRLVDGPFFEKAIQLRRIMGSCASDGRLCP